MRQTLFYIPDRIGEIPVFGVGLLLFVWIAACVAYLFWTIAIRKKPVDWIGAIPIMAIVAGIVWAILPRMVEPIPGDGSGLPIRGYGVMLLVAVVAAVMIAIHRARQVGYPTEAILTMTFFAFVSGIFGARLFYVIQMWDDQFYRPGDPVATLQSVLNVTQGGLVIYGGFIGGAAGVLGYLLWNRLPVFRTGDIIAPSLMIGLCLGRLGCLLNGCCYGGVCGDSWMGIQFPAGSVPYMEQLQRGTLIGADLELSDDRRTLKVVDIDDESVGYRAGLREGETLEGYQINPNLGHAMLDPDEAERTVAVRIEPAQGAASSVPVSELPRRSLALYPTQIISAIDAALICALLWFAYPFRVREGQIFGALLVLYPVTRFVEEMIRDDVPGYFGTSLTISQHVSLVLLGVAVLFWIGVYATSPPIASEERHEPAPA